MDDRFDYQPTLVGESVDLRPLVETDYGELFAVGSDPAIWEQHPAPDRHEEPRFRAFFDDSLASGGALTIRHLDSGQVMGSARFHDHDPGRGDVEIGWIFLGRQYWGGAFSREIVDLLIDHAFRFVPRVLWLAGVDNVRSQRAAEKLGARRVGRRSDASGNASIVYAFDR